ncbi:CBS domain-containing protein [Geovibrio thiophilus]|uniref:CBS domain-containing protein n=1 Tax=Geovibrio thiophilus TaxID=139438 RepID=A0A410JYL7_9BACT|nr:CBS domain-containing protein [Geovibrio thiophilus]QAR33223.1 CBS domain-containing protein [Geovibrio thiophilus]
MFVKNWMRREVITISPDETILDAKHIMKENGIRRLPVVEKNKLAGIITEKDIKEYSPSKASSLDVYELKRLLAKTLVKDAMNVNVITVHPETPIEKAALILRDKRFGGLPVVNDSGELSGIITAVDLFDIFVESMGFSHQSTRIAILLEDRKGALAEMTRIIDSHELNIVSLATFFLKNTEGGARDVVIRVNGEQSKIDAAVRDLRSADFNLVSIIEMNDIMNDV